MKQVMNLYDALAEAAGDPQNPEYKNWAKYVDYVDPDLVGGWMFVGDFVPKGTSEVEVKPSVFIVLSTDGPPEMPRGIYRIVIMDSGGKISGTNCWTDDSTPGWSYRLRDYVLDFLAEMEITHVMNRTVLARIIPPETLELLKEDAHEAMRNGGDVAIYPGVLLTLIEQYEELMNL